MSQKGTPKQQVLRQLPEAYVLFHGTVPHWRIYTSMRDALPYGFGSSPHAAWRHAAERLAK